MSKFNLDLSAFKHLSSSPDETTLRHDEHGHTITIKHSSLDEEGRKALESLVPSDIQSKQGPEMMAEGGKVKEYNYGQNDAPPKEKTKNEHKREVGREAAGGAPRGPVKSVGEAIDRLNPFKAEGGPVDDLGLVPDYSDPNETILFPEEGPETPIAEKIGNAIGEYAPKVLFPAADAAMQAYQDLPQGTGEKVAKTVGQFGRGVLNGAGADIQAPTIQQDEAAGAQEMASFEPPMAQLAPNTPMGQAAAEAPIDPNSPEAMYKHGYQQNMAGINAAATAAGQLGDQQAAILKERQGTLAQMQNEWDAQQKALNDERLDLVDDIKAGHVNPDKYWENHSKISAGIGMILAGFNPTNSPNAAVNFLKHQMDLNMQAQAKNLDSKQNLLSANLQQFRNLKDATEMTRIMQMDMLSTQLQGAAAKAQSPAAKAAALSAAGQLEMEASAKFQEFSANRALKALMQGASQDPTKMGQYITALETVDPKKAADMRERLIPGIGLANTKEDASALKEVTSRYSNINTNVRKAQDLIRKAGTFEALGPHNAELDMLAEQIATDQAKMVDVQSVARPQEVEAVKKTLVEAGLSTKNATAQKQLQNFMKTVDMRRDNAFNSRGMTPPDAMQRLSPQEQQYAKWAKANPNNPKAQLVLQKLGLR